MPLISYRDTLSAELKLTWEGWEPIDVIQTDQPSAAERGDLGRTRGDLESQEMTPNTIFLATVVGKETRNLGLNWTL